ncbi:hypothetical protein C8R45DRAFT_1188741 [Mycena sanguinolenta]|nr:hypothetical protein C8R45DRAFT_1188741 [Mycena sanguinolenta]
MCVTFLTFPSFLVRRLLYNLYAVAKLLRLLVCVPVLKTVDRRAAHPEVLTQILVLGIDEAPRAAALMMRFGANESIGFRWASYIFVFGSFVGFYSSLRVSLGRQLRRACLSGVLCRAKSTSISSSPSLLHFETKAFAPVRVVRGLVRIDCLRCATASASQSASTVLGLSHLGALDTPLLSHLSLVCCAVVRALSGVPSFTLLAMPLFLLRWPATAAQTRIPTPATTLCASIALAVSTQRRDVFVLVCWLRFSLDTDAGLVWLSKLELEPNSSYDS